MKRIPLNPQNSNGQRRVAFGATRAGATLSEALVALLIMAIGVISLASLFPIAVLKTAKANQLTTATDIRYNAEAMMKVYPWIFSDPNPADTGGPTGIPDTLPFNDYDFSAGRPFLFDPQGCVGTPWRPAPLPGAPGYVGVVPPGTGLGLLPRYGGGFSASLREADKICSGRDTWSLLHDNTISNFNAALTQGDLSNLNLAGLPPVEPAPPALPVAGGAQMRLQLFYNGGKSSLTRMVTGFSGAGTVLWTEDINGNSMLDSGEDQNGNLALDLHPLPTGISFETARLESRERRYSWMLTVRPQDASSSFTGGLGANPNFDVTVVVFFGRGFSLQDERVYGTLPAGSPAVPNLAAGSTVVNFNEGQPDFVMTWPAGETPNLKRGGWILDAMNGYWYQVDNYTDTTGATTSTVRLTSTILEPSTLLVVPRGVVDVFPIRPQSP